MLPKRTSTSAILCAALAALASLPACHTTSPNSATQPPADRRPQDPKPTTPAEPTPDTLPRRAPHSAEQQANADNSPEWITLAPGLRIDRATRTAEFDASVALDCHNPQSPDVYLELVACAPDTREHESLVVTEVPPSMIHAALLALGAEPGRPGDPAADRPPEGDPIAVAFIARAQSDEESRAPVPALSWITDAPTRTRRPDTAFVFAGSRQGREDSPIAYDADGTGTIVGLATFGSEVVAPTALIDPAADIDEPVWIADPRTVPAFRTPVRVRLTLRTTKSNQSKDEADASRRP